MTIAPSQPTVENFAVECIELNKEYGGVAALKGLSLSLVPGEVVALAGENGAGKSTLLKIIAGQVKADWGSVRISGEEPVRYDPVRAHRLGISMVPQELAPIPDMTVYENVFLGREIRTRAGLLDRTKMRLETRNLLSQFDVHIDPSSRMRRLSIGAQQVMEIVKSVYAGVKVLLMDEPSSAISGQEVERLYRIIERLRADGVAVVFTTHKMEEIRRAADRVIILRDGQLVADASANAINDDEIVTAMIGRELEDLFTDRALAPEDAPVALSVDAIRVEGTSEDVSLEVREGEIVALAGLIGAGRTELISSIFGVRSRRGGSVTVNGRAVRPLSAAAAIKVGMALVPEDRKGSGLVLSMSVAINGMLPHLDHFSTAGWIRTREAARVVDGVMSRLHLKAANFKQDVGTLSGGNQQKVVVGRWLTRPVRILLLDEPTRGVDVGARSEIYGIITDLAAAGHGVLIASSDMGEVIRLAHRALVLNGGQVVGELGFDDLARPDAQDRIFRLASGLEA